MKVPTLVNNVPEVPVRSSLPEQLKVPLVSISKKPVSKVPLDELRVTVAVGV